MKLTKGQQDEIFQHILEGRRFKYIAKEQGFKSVFEFQRYMIENEEFGEMIDRALVSSCMFLEDDLLHVADDYNKDEARVKLESISRLLKYRNPKRYGDKLDMSVVHTIDIAGSLAKAEQRIIDVTNTNNLVQIKSSAKK